MLKSRLSLAAAAVLLAGDLVLLAPHYTPKSAVAEPHDKTSVSANEASQANIKVFDEVWERLRDNFYDPNFRGRDWNKIRARFRPMAAEPLADMPRLINRMLAELNSSHTGYFTPDEIAYYDLDDIFQLGLSKRTGKGAYSGLGMVTRAIDGKQFIIGVFDGFPAARAGLLVGDEIVAADGKPFEQIRSFADKVGKKVTLSIRREADASPLSIEVVPQFLPSKQTFHAAMESGARIIEKDGHKLGYVHVWSYAGRSYQDLLEKLLLEGKLKDADALIWDLRDGWGGGQPNYLDIFNGRSPAMQLVGREGLPNTVNGRWRKPVILLINGGSRSAKEILAYGFKKYGYGETVGSRTAGAVLAGRAYGLSNGSLLLVAVTDVLVDGERLEGRGVAPDHEVPFDIRYAKGEDPQLAKAIEILVRQIN